MTSWSVTTLNWDTVLPYTHTQHTLKCRDRNHKKNCVISFFAWANVPTGLECLLQTKFAMPSGSCSISMSDKIGQSNKTTAERTWLLWGKREGDDSECAAAPSPRNAVCGLKWKNTENETKDRIISLAVAARAEGYGVPHSSNKCGTESLIMQSQNITAAMLLQVMVMWQSRAP